MGFAMTDKTITLDAELVERLEALAHGRDLNVVLAELLRHNPETPGRNWASALIEGMEAAEIDWLDEPDASITSRTHFEQELRERWLRTQGMEPESDE
jgi:predicted transcriptional regulator